MAKQKEWGLDKVVEEGVKKALLDHSTKTKYELQSYWKTDSKKIIDDNRGRTFTFFKKQGEGYKGTCHVSVKLNANDIAREFGIGGKYDKITDGLIAKVMKKAKRTKYTVRETKVGWTSLGKPNK